MHGLLFLIERQKETKQNKSTTSGPHPVWFQLRCDWWSPGLPRWLAHPEDDHWFEQYLVFCGFFLAPNNPASYQHAKIKRHRRRSLKNKRKWILAQLGAPRTSADREMRFLYEACDDDLYETSEYYLGCRMKTPQTLLFSVNYPGELRQLGRFHITRPVQGYELIV